MKIKDIKEFRTWFKNLRKSRQNEWCNENFIGSYHGHYTGFLGMYHGDKDDIYGFLRKEVEMAEDGQAIYEFVQNAADSDSTKFYMFYNENYLLAINNGDVFSRGGVKSILNIGQSYGKADPDKIGRFGIGFKLVHRLIGKTQGLDELLNTDGKGYRGPSLFSWSSKEQLDNFLVSDLFEKSNFGHDDSPWLFKILLTNFPAFPEEEILDINYKKNIPFSKIEVIEFQEYLNSCLKKLNTYDLKQGSIFFIKLGEEKYELLRNQETEYLDGLETSMHFLKSLNYIQINDIKLKKDKNVKDSVKFIIKNGTDNFLKIGLTENRDKESDIIFNLSWGDNIEAAKKIKLKPNIYRFFPAVKEINNLAFILHSNVFELTSNRQNLTETSINKNLLSSFSYLLIKMMNNLWEKDFVEFTKLFSSILFSDINTNWQSEYFIKNLLSYARLNIPTKNEYLKLGEHIVIKNTECKIDPIDFGINRYWFFWSNSKDNLELIKQAESKLSIKKWDIKKLLEKGKVSSINSWITSLDNEQYKLFLKELNEHIPKKNINNIAFVKCIDDHLYSIDEIINREKIIINFNKISRIKKVLIELGFILSEINISDYGNIENLLKPHIKYLKETEESNLFIDYISKSTSENTLKNVQKRDLFLCMKSLHNVGPSMLSGFKLFCNSQDVILPLKQLINSKLEVPFWLEKYKIKASENIFVEISEALYLRNDKTIYESIIFPEWDYIISKNNFSNSNIVEFYNKIKYYYSCSSKTDKTTLEEKAYLFSNEGFLYRNDFIYHSKLTGYSDYCVLQPAIKAMTGSIIPDKDILPFLENDPFQTSRIRFENYLQNFESDVNEVKIIIDFCEKIGFDLFAHGVFKHENFQLVFQKNENLKQYYSDNQELIRFVNQYLSNSFIMLPDQLSDFKYAVLSKDKLEEAISNKRECNSSHQNELLLIFSGKEFDILLNKIENIRFIYKEKYTTNDFEYKLLYKIDINNISELRTKLIIRSTNNEFMLNQIKSSNEITFGANKKYKIKLSKILPDSELYDNASIISSMQKSFSDLEIQNNKLKKIFFIEDEPSANTQKKIFNELSNTIENPYQLAFILLYNNNIAVTDLSKFEIYDFESVKQQLEYSWYSNKHSIIANSKVLAKRYIGINVLLQLSSNNPVFNVNNSKCKIIFEPFFDDYEDDNFSFHCDYIRTNMNNQDKKKLLKLLYNYWQKSKIHKNVIQEINWSKIDDKNSVEIIGFNPYLILWNDQFSNESEKCPKWVKDWSNNHKNKIKFLSDFGINTEESQIYKIRDNLISGNLFEDKIKVDNKYEKILLKTTFNWIKENNIDVQDEKKFGLLKKIKDELNIDFEVTLDVEKLENNSEPFNDVFKTDYYNDWSEKFGYYLFFYDGEMPYNVEYNGYILRNFEENDVVQNNKRNIFLNQNTFKTEEDLFRIDPIDKYLSPESKNYLFMNIGAIKHRFDKILRIENEQLKRENELLRKDTSESFLLNNITKVGNLSIAQQIEQIEETKVIAKKFLSQKGFDCSDWDDNQIPSTIIKGVKKSGKNITIVLRSAMGNTLHLQPEEWILFDNQNILLVIRVDEKNFKIIDENIKEYLMSLDKSFTIVLNSQNSGVDAIDKLSKLFLDNLSYQLKYVFELPQKYSGQNNIINGHVTEASDEEI